MRDIAYFIVFAVYVARHKWFVFVEGVRIGGIPIIRLIAHDLSKFRTDERVGYTLAIVRPRGTPIPPEGDAARRLHRKRNKHHWQFWTDGDTVNPMPHSYVREMVADWIAASQSYDSGGRNIVPYLRNRVSTMRLHEETQTHLRGVLAEVGIDWNSIVSEEA